MGSFVRSFVSALVSLAAPVGLGVSLVAIGCGSSDGGGAPADSDVGDVASDVAHDTTPADDGTDESCPPIGSSCPGEAFVGCTSEWKGVNRWECHGGRWCAEPGLPPSFSDAACPTDVPTAGAACTPPDGADGYEWCGYTCGDGAVHAMVCAAGIWCGDATSTCTLVTKPDAGPDASSEADVASDTATDASDAPSDAIDGASDETGDETSDAGADADETTAIDAGSGASDASGG